MNEEMDQPEQDMIKASVSVRKQGSVSSDNWAYEETPLPYLPSPEAKPVRTRSLPRTRVVRDPSSSLPNDPGSGINGKGPLFGMLLGALVGVALSFFVGENLFLWGIIGAIAGGMMPFMPEILVGASRVFWEGIWGHF